MNELSQTYEKDIFYGVVLVRERHFFIFKGKEMESKTCCFIGHRNVSITNALQRTLKEWIEKLIVQENVETFLFGSKSSFDDFCFLLVSQMKKAYPHIKRVYVRSDYLELPKCYSDCILKLYDETYMPKRIENAGRASYVERNQEMIERSDFILFYYDENYAPKPVRQSGTQRAYEYAVRKNKDGKKKIINVYEQG